MSDLIDNLADTRHRLLQSAGEIFAEHGFRQATVRDIIERAGVNIAAVNYHFRDKQGLYVAVLQHWLGAALEKYPPDGGLPQDAPAPDRLSAFIRSFLFRLMDEGVPAWHGKLLAREMADPTPGVIEMLVQNHMRPHANILFTIVAELLGKSAGEDRIRLCAFSIVGQILFYRHCEATIRLIAPGQRFDSAAINRVAEHISQFALAGLEIYAKPKKAVRRRPVRLLRKRP